MKLYIITVYHSIYGIDYQEIHKTEDAARTDFNNKVAEYELEEKDFGYEETIEEDDNWTIIQCYDYHIDINLKEFDI